MLIETVGQVTDSIYVGPGKGIGKFFGHHIRMRKRGLYAVVDGILTNLREKSGVSSGTTRMTAVSHLDDAPFLHVRTLSSLNRSALVPASNKARERLRKENMLSCFGVGLLVDCSLSL